MTCEGALAGEEDEEGVEEGGVFFKVLILTITMGKKKTKPMEKPSPALPWGRFLAKGWR